MQQVAQTEQEFLAEYDPRKFEPVAVSVDVVALTIRDDVLCALLVRRDSHPFKDRLALPGTFVRPYTFDPEPRYLQLDQYARGALLLKTTISGAHVEQLQTFGSPGRDPRMHVISVAFLAFGGDIGEPSAGHGVAEAEWIPVDQVMAIGASPLAFDHHTILGVGIERAKSKLEYTTLATTFLPEEFTIGDLRHVYEIVWGHDLHASNFYRKVLASEGFVEPIEGAKRVSSRSGPYPQLFKAGPARMLYPPIKREGGDWS